jgi:hypothetical protein
MRPQEQVPSQRLRAPALALLATALVGVLVARLLHLGSGPFDGDESYVVLHALQLGTGDFNPGHFDWPASLLYYLTFCAYGLVFCIGWVLQIFPSPEAFAARVVAEPQLFYLVPRLISCGFGLASAVVLWRLLRRMGWGEVAPIAALFLLAAPIHVLMSRRGLAEAPMVFFVTATLYFAQRIASARAPLRDYLWAGAMIGCAASMKYHGALACLCVVAAHVHRQHGVERELRRPLLGLMQRELWLAGGMALGAFVLTTPFALLDFTTFRADLTFQLAHQAGGVEHFGAGQAAPSIAQTAGPLLARTLGLPLLCAGALGFALLLRRPRENALPLCLIGAPGLAYAGALLKSQVLLDHYAIPLVPLFALAAAAGIASLGALASRRTLLAGLAAVLVLANVAPSIEYALRRGIPDIQSAVQRWILEECTEHDKIALELEVPVLPSDASIERHLQRAEEAGMSGRTDYWRGVQRLAAAAEGLPRRDLYFVYDHDEAQGLLARLGEQGVRYFVHSEGKLVRFEHSAHLEEARVRLALYEQLRSSGREVAVFEGYATSYRGYTVRVFELPLASPGEAGEELACASLNPPGASSPR